MSLATGIAREVVKAFALCVVLNQKRETIEYQASLLAHLQPHQRLMTTI